MKVVAIGGCSGSGKTHLARALSARLGECETIELDSYYWPLPALSVEERATRNFDHPESIDWQLLEAHLRALSKGEAVQVPVYLFDQHTRSSETRLLQPVHSVVVEGILALHHPSIRDLAHVKVFVETAADECLRRRMERDVSERGRSRQSVLDQYQTTVIPMAREFVLPSRHHADMIVSGQQLIAHAVEQIIRRL